MSTTTVTSTVAYELQPKATDSGRGTISNVSNYDQILSNDEGNTLRENRNNDTASNETVQTLKPFRINLIILQISLASLLASMSTGIVVVGLPHIAKAIALPERLYLWPSSVYSLTTGATLLLAGAIADVIGPRTVDIIGCFMAGIFTLACGLSQTGIELVMFRALQGIGMAMHFPCSVSLISRFIPAGRPRNIAFACTGFAMPIGYSLGLVVGGIMVDTIGWRVGFYIPGAIMLAQSAIAFWLIPADAPAPNLLEKLRKEIDWFGATIACAALAMFSYVLAIISTDSSNIRQPSAITMLIISVILMLLFPVWINFQERNSRPALIPNSLWKNMHFTTVCLLTVPIYAVQTGIEVFSSLYFQEVQDYSAFQTSLRLIPALVVGAVLNLATGFFIDRFSPVWPIAISALLTAGSPVVMALIKPAWPYWWGAFPAQLLAPISGDIFFTVGLIIISEVFPDRTQALAGAVFNTVVYFGQSFGINTMQVVSMLVTDATAYRDKSSPLALLQGYRATFWYMFAAMVAAAVGASIGLRKLNRIGLKRD